MSRPRLPHEILLAVGGWSGGAPTNTIEAYDNRANRWTNITSQVSVAKNTDTRNLANIL